MCSLVNSELMRVAMFSLVELGGYVCNLKLDEIRNGPQLLSIIIIIIIRNQEVQVMVYILLLFMEFYICIYHNKSCLRSI